MAEEKTEQREVNIRSMLPWMELFRSFQVALDPKKLLLAAGGILFMALGWYALASGFYSLSGKPTWNANDYPPSKFQGKNDTEEMARQKAWEKFKQDRERWRILWQAAGDGNERDRFTDAGDLALSLAEYEAPSPEGKTFAELVNEEIEQMKKDKVASRKVTFQGKEFVVAAVPAGELRQLPWFEDRGENPYLLVTNQAAGPWQAGHFGEWVLMKQVPVLVEPLRKFVTPVIGLLRPSSGPYASLYFLTLIVWTLAVWGLFGGAITRMASVQLARNEKISMREALRFVWTRYVSFLSAPLFPLLFVAFFVLLLTVYSFLFMIPWVGDIVVAGVGWPLVLIVGIIMAAVLVGLVGWPMMYATISAEGSDSFDAISRSYSYIYQCPWSYAWYSIVALAYGAAVVFFIGFMGSMAVYLGKWGVSKAPAIVAPSREPSFLFAYAPESFGWRALLLDGAKVEGQNVVQNGEVKQEVWNRLVGRDESYTGKDRMTWANQAGAYMVAAWLYLFFLMILGFGYSFFWTASTIIYLLMRRKVDDTDLDEIYLEEDDADEPYATGTGLATAPPPTAATGAHVTMVEAPTLRTSSPPPSPPTPPLEKDVPAAPAASGDGAKPAVDGGASS